MKKRTKAKKYSLTKAFGWAVRWTLRGIREAVPSLVVVLVFFMTLQGVRKQLFADEMFSLSRITLKTDGVMKQEDIAAISGAKTGDNILQIDLKEMTRRLESDPRIREAMVLRQLPNQLAVSIKERREILRVQQPGLELAQAMDRDGFLLGPANKDSVLPVYSDLRTGAAAKFAGGRYRDAAALKTVFGLSKMAGTEPLFRTKKLSKILIRSADRTDLVFEDGFELRVGRLYEGDFAKLKAMRALFEQEIETFEYLDLRFRNIVAKKKEVKRK